MKVYNTKNSKLSQSWKKKVIKMEIARAHRRINYLEDFIIKRHGVCYEIVF
jgi:hypothetical protein